MTLVRQREAASEVRAPGRLLATVWRRTSVYLRSSAFVRAQVMVALIVLIRYASGAIPKGSPFSNVDEIAPVLSLLPIIYASLFAPRAGGILTALAYVLLRLPDVASDVGSSSHGPLRWLVELIQLVGTGPVVALVISRLVARHSAERRRAQETAERLADLSQQVVLQSIRAQEEERRRIARELHDETVQRLVSVCQGIDHVATAWRLPRGAAASLDQLRRITEETLSGVRRLSRDLRPTLLDDLGLVAAVEWLVAELAKRRGLHAQVTVTGPRLRLARETELHLFRIVQETLRNVERHSQAANVSVSLAFGQGTLEVRVRDDGTGFDPGVFPNGLVAAGKLGLVGVRERSHLIGSTLSLESAIGQGTNVTVTLDHVAPGQLRRLPSAERPTTLPLAKPPPTPPESRLEAPQARPRRGRLAV